MKRKELVFAMKEIEKSNKLKTEIIANMNQEIRTPLYIIKGSVALIKVLSKANNTDPDLIETIESLDAGVNRLNRTMEMFADLSSLKSGNYKVNLETINLKCILIHNLLTYEKSIIEQNKNIKISLDTNIEEAYTNADETTTLRSVEYIVDNAVKFTHNGYVKIGLSEVNNKFIVKIEDTGIEMSEDYQKLIFDPFSQEDMRATRKYEGIGLSMSLVNEYAQLNNFNISFEFKQNMGTTFILEFDKFDI